IIDVFPSPSIVKIRGTVAINVTVLNVGTITETFNVSVYYNAALLETRTLVLNAGARTTPTFTWVTISEGVYLIWAEVEQLPEEANVTNNVFVDGTVTVSSLQPPVASFTFSPMSPYTGQDVTFDASLSYDLDGTIDSYTWSFGDGAIGNGKIVTHSYTDNGTYEVELTVVDNDGLTDIESESITVLNRHPVASFTESAETAYVGDAVTFNASESHDPDGYIVSYFWNFGDGANATGVIVDHAYAVNATFTVTLTITDDDGASASADATETILVNESPVAIFTESAETVYTGETTVFNATESYDPDGSIIDYFWIFGDETNDAGTIVSHAYTDDGTYIVTLTITDDDGATALASAAKTVLNRPPIANFTESAETVYTSEVIYFNASASYDLDGTVVSYWWDFGDGANATGVTVDHAYADDGSYAVTLTVTDDDGATASAVALEIISNRSPTAVFTCKTSTAYSGEVIPFDASASYDPDGSIVSYTWNFGDDNITTSFTTTINHTYTTPGTYNVTLTVTDDDGLTDDKVKTLTVETAPWPLSLIVVIILLIVAATATAIYLVRKWRRKIKGR
ncbi:PKD domain-containing protein, partial [Candidatus Bathyarchaeota archaeon]|nr:PKD domain-containing protein [Candidatus Bathyarchaeota archaeon]